MKRIIDMPTNGNRTEALRILCCSEKDDAREMKRKYRLLVLARKYYPDKWCDVYDFDRMNGAVYSKIFRMPMHYCQGDRCDK